MKWRLLDWIVVGFVGLLLLALVAILAMGTVNGHPRTNRTKVFIEALDKACQSYRLDYGVFPPGDSAFSSRPLHKHLGRSRMIQTINVMEGQAPQVQRPPIFDFRPAELLWDGPGLPSPDQPVPLVDRWGREIRYRNPGVRNERGVDLWSLGQNGREELDPKRADFDDFTNWVSDF